MKKYKNKWKYILSISLFIVVCFLANLFCNKTYKISYKDKHTKETNLIYQDNKTAGQLDTNSNGKKWIQETSGGFYLYNKNNEPIMNDQKIKIDEDGYLEINVECVNDCEIELNYYVVILVNDYYQRVSYKNEQGKFSGKGKLAAGAHEVVNIKTVLKNIHKTDNELRIIMFYYPNKIPEDSLDQVIVGDSVGIYKIKTKAKREKDKNERFIHMKSHLATTSNDTMAIWLTEDRCTNIPKFDFILNLKKDGRIYLNAVGKNKIYVGMIFSDGIPAKIGDNYSFLWKQKKGKLMECKINKRIKGNVMFAYMYEKGGDINNTYATNLYKLN